MAAHSIGKIRVALLTFTKNVTPCIQVFALYPLTKDISPNSLLTRETWNRISFLPTLQLENSEVKICHPELQLPISMVTKHNVFIFRPCYIYICNATDLCERV